MKTRLLLMMWSAGLVLALPGCKLFHKSAPKPKAPVPFFTEMPKAGIGAYINFDFAVSGGGGSGFHVFSVFPVSDKPYAADYDNGGKTGFFTVTDEAKKHARNYQNYFGYDSMVLDNMSAVWLSADNYRELKWQGFTLIKVNPNQPMDTFRFTGIEKLTVKDDDSALTFDVVNARSTRNFYTLQFLADSTWPMITGQRQGFVVSLNKVMKHEPDYLKFTPGEGCVLRYEIHEYGNHVCDFTATCVKWTDSLVCFHIDGSRLDEPSFDFEYDLCFSGNAVRTPSFEVPYFSAVAKSYTEKTVNHFFIQRKQLDTLLKLGRYYLNVPHFAVDPGMTDTTDFDPEDLKEMRRKYRESYHTLFSLQHSGKLLHTPYTFWDENAPEGEGDRLLATYYLTRVDGTNPFELQLLAAGTMPLVVYYNDHWEYEMKLVYAGYNK